MLRPTRQPGGTTEEATMRRYLMKAIQDDAQRAGERDRLLSGGAAGPRGAPPARGSRRSREAPGPAAVSPGRPPRTAGRALVNRTARRPRAAIEHTVRSRGHEALVDDGAAAEQASPPLAPNWNPV